MLSHTQGKSVPLGVAFGNVDDARYSVVNVVAQMFVKRQSNGCIYVFVVCHNFCFYIGMLPCFLAGRLSRLVAS